VPLGIIYLLTSLVLVTLGRSKRGFGYAIFGLDVTYIAD
jgi:hypothetical protein